jgi:pilus assembly protein CpaE
VRQAGRLLAYLDDLGIDRERVRLIVNRMMPKVKFREKDVEAALKMPVASTIPEGARHLSHAVQRGVPLVLDRPRSPVANSLFHLAASLNGRV